MEHIGVIAHRDGTKELVSMEVQEFTEAPATPSESDLILSTVLDHEERLCIMELNAE